jgi:hypothetical protein
VADEAVLNIVLKKREKIPPPKKKNFTLGQPKWIKSKNSGFGQIPGYFPHDCIGKRWQKAR